MSIAVIGLIFDIVGVLIRGVGFAFRSRLEIFVVTHFYSSEDVELAAFRNLNPICKPTLDTFVV